MHGSVPISILSYTVTYIHTYIDVQHSQFGADWLLIRCTGGGLDIILHSCFAYQRPMGSVEECSGWHDPQAHEEEPRDLEAGIRIRNLTKIYDQVFYLNSISWRYMYMYIY